MAGAARAVVAVASMETTPTGARRREAGNDTEATTRRRAIQPAGGRRADDPLFEWLGACGEDDLRVIARVLAETQGFRTT